MFLYTSSAINSFCAGCGVCCAGGWPAFCAQVVAPANAKAIRSPSGVVRMALRIYRILNLLGGFGITTRVSNDVHIGNAFGWNTKLLLQFLVRNPLKSYIRKLFEWRNINLGIVDLNAHVQSIVIHSRIAFLHAHVHAMRMAGRIEPCPIIHADAIDHEGVVPVPMPHGIAIPSGRRTVFGVDALGKFSPIHPYFAPDSLILGKNDHPVRQLSEAHASCLVDDIARKAQGIARHQWIVRVRKVIYRLGLIQLCTLRAERSIRWEIPNETDGAGPSAIEITFGSWCRWFVFG